ncbi:hypothetical protein MKZ26_03305 [Sporosarcina sp. FSL K6-6792]|uniref:hypothetical protein n=1 Tax=Sporosarcina sp. FSL K6-6792 TaxID=2921559 RepID=UPI0030FBDA27
MGISIPEILKGVMENLGYYLLVWIVGSLLLTGLIVLILRLLRVPRLIGKPIWVIAFAVILYFGYLEFFIPGISG